MPPRHIKLLEKAIDSPNNWKVDQLISMYQGFGFSIESGGKHMAVYHEKITGLRTTFPFGRKTLKAHYVRTAIKLIRELQSKGGVENE